MKKITTLCLLMIIFSLASAQDTISLTDATLLLKHNESESFFFGLTVGDKVVLNIEEEKGKEIGEVMVIEQPSNTIYSSVKENKVAKSIKITRENVYEFKITNKNLFKKKYRVSIQRIPASKETENFNTAWKWKTIYDTTYQHYTEDSLVGHDTTNYTEHQKVVKQKKLEEVVLMNRTEVVKSSGIIVNDNPRASVQIAIPNDINTDLVVKRTVKWAYWLGVGENANAFWSKLPKAVSSGVSVASPLAGMLAGTVTELAIPQGKDNVDYYITDANNSALFMAGQQFSYIQKGFGSGGSDVFSVNKGNNRVFYINLKNPNVHDRINVLINASASVETTEYEYQDIPKQKITPKYVSVSRTKMNVTKTEIRVNAK
ncbi:MAG: hypothetical protein J6T33_02535 [Bacteroidales bacterium]|nr:hypothetical protein [Bacteroidales bacterium]